MPGRTPGPNRRRSLGGHKAVRDRGWAQAATVPRQGAKNCLPGPDRGCPPGNRPRTAGGARAQDAISSCANPPGAAPPQWQLPASLTGCWRQSGFHQRNPAATAAPEHTMATHRKRLARTNGSTACASPPDGLDRPEDASKAPCFPHPARPGPSEARKTECRSRHPRGADSCHTEGEISYSYHTIDLFLFFHVKSF